MKRIVMSLVAASMVMNVAVASDERPQDKPREAAAGRDESGGAKPEARGGRDGEARGERGPRDGERPQGERPPGDRPRGEGGQGRGPRDGDRPNPGRGGFGLAALDANHNGVLESEEIDQAIVVLRRMDRNGDGKLTPDELGMMSRPDQNRTADARGPRDGERPPGENGRPPREGDRPPGDRPQGGRPTPDQMMARFLESDTNKDGKLSKEEAPDRMKENFDRADADSSGYIEKSEMEQMIKRMMQNPEGRPPGGDRPREGGDRPRGGDDAPREGGRGRPDAE